MFDSIHIFFQEWGWVFLCIISVKVMHWCRDNRRYLTEPSDFYFWGVFSWAIIEMAINSPKG